MSLNKEQSVQWAVNELEMGLFLSIGKAAMYHGIVKSTAAHWCARWPSIKATDRKSQRLLKEEEKVLLQYFWDLQ